MKYPLLTPHYPQRSPHDHTTTYRIETLGLIHPWWSPHFDHFAIEVDGERGVLTGCADQNQFIELMIKLRDLRLLILHAERQTQAGCHGEA